MLGQSDTDRLKTPLLELPYDEYSHGVFHTAQTDNLGDDRKT